MGTRAARECTANSRTKTQGTTCVIPSSNIDSYFNLEEVIDYSPLNFVGFDNPSTSQSPFDSNFESGNLLYAYRVSNSEYDLILQNDTNTKGYNQWFYYSYQF